MPEQKVDIVIIGAGLTGLTAAYYLTKAGKKVLVLEKEDRVGGVIRTHHEDGFIFESGPNTGVLGNPEVVELFENLAGQCSLEIANPKAKKRWIWKKGLWNPLPSGLLSAIRTPLFTFKDKIRILGEPFRKKGNNPMESIAEMVIRRLGKSYLDYAVDPFISGVYAGDPHKLVTQYALPKLYALEQNYGSFIKGSIKKQKAPKTERDKKATREVFSARGGLNHLIDALWSQTGKDKFILGIKNVSVKRENENFRITFLSNKGEEQTLYSEKVISTIGGHALPDVFGFIPKNKLKPILDMEYAKVVQVILGYKNWKGIPVNAFGGLAPSVEKRNILGVLFTSSFFMGRCPENGVILSVFLGGMKRPEIIEWSDESIKTKVLSEIAEMFHLIDVNPDLLRIFRYQHAIPQYGFNSPEKIKCIQEMENEFSGLLLAGNIRDGIGMADRIKQATEIANQIIKK